PVQGQVSERFGKQGAGIANEGITITAPAGTPIRAAQAGEVAYVGHNVRDYGNIVILRHANGDMTSYAHASDIVVQKGQH
ncbi:murein hydrolase activator EnvC family protein, partial [Staphylococcus aureus]